MGTLKAKGLSLEELMKPTVITCGNCGGNLHIIPIRKELGDGKFTIETINLCGKCSFQELGRSTA